MAFESLTTTSTLATASTSPHPSSTPKSEPFKGSGSSNLYLTTISITFLATLFLLLFVSSGIVLRSYILRRRFQRQIDEAVAAGFLLSPRAQGSRKRHFGAKPKIYNSWVTSGGHKWSEMMPISALPVRVKRRAKNDPPSKPSQQLQDPQSSSSQLSSTPPPEPSRLHRRLLHPFRTHHQQPVVESIPITEPEKPRKPKIDMLQVSVLISMPSANRPVSFSTSTLAKTDEDDDEMIPEVVFGVTRLPYKPPE